jgi:hypothetical protein
MKLADIFDKTLEKPKKFRSHSENDLIASIKKVLEGSHFHKVGFELKSSDKDLGDGNLVFTFKKRKYKITLDGEIYENGKKIDEIKSSSDIHHHYSLALHRIIKKIKSDIKDES